MFRYGKGICITMEKTIEKLRTAGFLIASISVYQEIKSDPVIQCCIDLIECLAEEDSTMPLDYLAAEYAAVCAQLYESKFKGNLSDYIYNKVLLSENLFTLEAARGNYAALPDCVRAAATKDLNALYALTCISSEDFRTAMVYRFPESADLIALLPDYINGVYYYHYTGCWGDHIAKIAEYHRHNGTGIYSEEIAFIFDGEQLLPVKNVDSICLNDLKHYEAQRNKIVENTLSFLHGKPCNNVLLYGDRGTGKSSTVKALLNEYYGLGLRIVQIEKKNLNSLSRLIDLLSDSPLRFIIFIDDLTFNENDDGFGALKACLEGSLSKKSDNTVIYATSNRRHLIKETFTSREGDEVHRADTIDDSLSLSDRFGLTITFMVPDKAKYLDIVEKVAEDRGLQVNRNDLLKGAERFALQKSGRSPRIARQYVDFVQGRIEMGLPLD